VTMERRGKLRNLSSAELGTGPAARLAGLHPATLRRWADRGAIKPAIYGHGRGAVYGWTIRDVVAARAIRRLRERVSAQRLRRVVRGLERYGEDLASAVLVCDARGVYRVLPSGDLLGLLDGGQIRAVALAPIEKAVRAQARKEGIKLSTSTG